LLAISDTKKKKKEYFLTSLKECLNSVKEKDLEAE